MVDLFVRPALSRGKEHVSTIPDFAVILFTVFMASIFATSNSRAADVDQAPAQRQAAPPADCAPAVMDTQRVETDPEFTEQVMQQLASPEAAERIRALSQLSVHQPPIDPDLLQDMLFEALNDTDAYVRGQAVYAMAKQGDIEYLSVLQQALADPELQVRLMMLDGLDKNEWTRLLLEQAMQDDDESVREFAAEKLVASTSR